MSEIQASAGPLSLACRRPSPPRVLTWSFLCLSESPLTIRAYWIWATPPLPASCLQIQSHSEMLGIGEGHTSQPVTT